LIRRLRTLAVEMERSHAHYRGRQNRQVAQNPRSGQDHRPPCSFQPTTMVVPSGRSTFPIDLIRLVKWIARLYLRLVLRNRRSRTSSPMEPLRPQAGGMTPVRESGSEATGQSHPQIGIPSVGRQGASHASAMRPDSAPARRVDDEWRRWIVENLLIG